MGEPKLEPLGLNQTQRALVAGKMATGGDGLTNRQAAAEFGVHAAYVPQAKMVIQYGTLEELAACMRGELNISTVANQIRRRLALEVAPAKVVKLRRRRALKVREVEERKPDRRFLGARLAEDQTPETLAREVLASVAAGSSMEAAAKAAHIDPRAARMISDIVLIADRTDLSPRETEIAVTALRRMNDGDVALSEVYGTVREIAERLWGTGKAFSTRSGQETARVERFEHALGVIIQSCQNASRIEVAHLDQERARAVVQELGRALESVKVLVRKIRGMHAHE